MDSKHDEGGGSSLGFLELHSAPFLTQGHLSACPILNGQSRFEPPLKQRLCKDLEQVFQAVIQHHRCSMVVCAHLNFIVFKQLNGYCKDLEQVFQLTTAKCH